MARKMKDVLRCAEKQNKYDECDINSIYQYARGIEGKTLLQILQEANLTEEEIEWVRTKESDKGLPGKIIEASYFGYELNSRQEADFVKVGAELKSTPADMDKTTEKYKSGETISVTQIDFSRPVEDDFYKSHLYNKLKMLIVIFYHRNRKLPSKLLYNVIYATLFQPSSEDMAIIESDYHEINHKIRNGRAHELSRSDKEILDDGKIVITNEEQHNYPFKINIKISPNANKLSFTVTPFNPTNREYLNYKTFLRRVMNDEKVSLWLLDRNERFIQGTLDYSADENLYEEIEFLQKIVAIEEYFETTINIPNSITAGEHAVINRLYDLIQGGYKGNLDKFDFSFELCDENRPRLLSLTETDYVLGYSAEGTFSIFNQKLIVPIFREIECVKVENLGRLKEKIRILDNGDQVKIVYVPGTGKKTCDYVDRIKTEEIENGLLFSKEH